MSQDLVEAIRNRLTVEEVVGFYLDLKPAGSNLKTLSPFNAEKTPSFMVSPSKQIWYDFSSQRGGDLFKFVQEYEGVSFPKALEILAQRAGLNMADFRRISPQAKKRSDRRKKLIDVCQQASELYFNQLLKAIMDKGQIRDYYRRRGFNKETCLDFKMGYAPAGSLLLKQFHQIGKIDKKLLESAGLIKKQTTGRWRDVFLKRLLVPLMTTDGSTIGFCGRIVDDKSKAPKYLNSPKTEVYDKSNHVFGFYQARPTIRRVGFVVIVEGNFDVLTAHQNQFKMTVAAGGTALTVDHLKFLRRYTDDFRLALDGDRAGVAATERIIKMAQPLRLKLSILSLPIGQDPDDLIRGQPKEWQKIFDQPISAIDWLFGQYQKQADLTSADGQKQFLEKTLNFLADLKDPLTVNLYCDKLSKKVNLSASQLEDQCKQLIESRDYKKRQRQQYRQETTSVWLNRVDQEAKDLPETISGIEETKIVEAQKHAPIIVAALIKQPDLILDLEDNDKQSLQDFLNKNQQDIYQLIEADLVNSGKDQLSQTSQKQLKKLLTNANWLEDSIKFPNNTTRKTLKTEIDWSLEIVKNGSASKKIVSQLKSL